MKFKNLSFVFVWLFLIVSLAFIPQRSLISSFSVEAALSWLGVLILSGLTIRSLFKAKNEYGEFFLLLKSKFKPKPFKASKTVDRLILSGGSCWFLILLFKDSLFPIPLFILGAILMVWGLSLCLEENGVYKFSETRLSNKWILAAISSSVLYWAGFTAASQINSVFGIDPSFFPFSFSAMIVFNVATLLFLLMIPVFLASSAVMVVGFISEVKNREVSKDNSAILPLVLAFSAYAAIFGLTMLQPAVQLQAARSIALKTDFNSKNVCQSEWLNGKPVIFLGPNLKYVLSQSKENAEEFKVQECLSL
ncbi:hypothetical protein [Marinobacter sp. LV10MA510-1]|uniref:hypothetical protein n=1 Tax=Marinobacter sp. LV10MA510-1 TaxID=1415567 RepID=UPI000BF64195|nr:hypothetical protein [Marinobacter sp. LV10MA510-1]PFG11415.1 hypothetical protein ATI45_3931 [Marinobacter sp. LV10MA510-1]